MEIDTNQYTTEDLLEKNWCSDQHSSLSLNRSADRFTTVVVGFYNIMYKFYFFFVCMGIEPRIMRLKVWVLTIEPADHIDYKIKVNVYSYTKNMYGKKGQKEKEKE